MNIPNLVTFARLLLIPVFIGVYYLPFVWSSIASAIVFVLAGMTDWLDGYLARKLGQTSRFGEFLDPVADKLIVVIALVLLVSNPKLPYISLPVVVIIGREIVISALREWMAEIGKRTSVAVTFISKLKTTLQMVAIIAILASNPLLPKYLLWLGYILLYLAASLTLWTMIIYLKTAWPDFQLTNNSVED